MYSIATVKLGGRVLSGKSRIYHYTLSPLCLGGHNTYANDSTTVITPKAKKLELVIQAHPTTPSAVV